MEYDSQKFRHGHSAKKPQRSNRVSSLVAFEHLGHFAES